MGPFLIGIAGAFFILMTLSSVSFGANLLWTKMNRLGIFPTLITSGIMVLGIEGLTIYMFEAVSQGSFYLHSFDISQSWMPGWVASGVMCVLGLLREWTSLPPVPLSPLDRIMANFPGEIPVKDIRVPRPRSTFIIACNPERDDSAWTGRFYLEMILGDLLFVGYDVRHGGSGSGPYSLYLDGRKLGENERSLIDLESELILLSCVNGDPMAQRIRLLSC